MFTFSGINKDELATYINDHTPRLSAIYNLINTHTPAQGKVLDIGAKPYVLSYMLHKAGFHYTGIGVSQEKKDLREDPIQACEIVPTSNQPFTVNLKDNHHDIPLTIYETNIELNTWPFPKEYFDTLVWTETLEHLTFDPSFAWHQANIILRNQGILIFSVPNALYWIRAIQLLLGKNIDDPYSWHGPFGRHNRLYTTTEILTLAKLHGFEPISLTTQTFLPEHISSGSRVLRNLINLVSTIFGKRKGKTIVAVFQKVRESKEVIRPSFLYH
ncbi:MAG: methyltransferase domain-containing protein [Candidatus Abawacabacteria bacterium]|nr:methyltransferase domain-containing protein [Candidatus Abawacabacteria bacterium]